MSQLDNTSKPGHSLHIRMPDGSERQFSLEMAEIKVGRAPQNDLVLDHPSISRQHARLILAGDQVIVEDLGSANGTFLGEETLNPGTSRVLQPDQVLRFGYVEVSLQHTAAAQIDPEAGATVMEVLPTSNIMHLQMPDGSTL